MIKSKKQMFIIISVFIVALMLGTVTYAFFNYTRTGSNNTIRTGKMSFNHTQGPSINITNVFPIDVTNGIPNDATKVGTVTINVKGDTTYDKGIEYLVSAVNVSNTAGNKRLPISISITVEDNDNNNPATSLGTSAINGNYFAYRGDSSSIYKVVAEDILNSNDELLYGYIAPGVTGVDGNIVIKAYIDKAKIAISDTTPEETVRTVKTTGYSSSDCTTVLTGVENASTYCATAASLQSAIDNEDLTDGQINALLTAGIIEEYTNGTTSNWVNGRTVFTTAEWNSLQTNGVSFKIKVEANEGIWIENLGEIETCPKCQFVYTTTHYDFGTNGSTLSNFNTNIETLVDDYRLLNKNHFLGFKIENGVAVKAYTCGIKQENPNQGTAFCLEGTTDGENYEEVQSVLNNSTTGIWQGGCTDSPYTFCSGGVNVIAYADGDYSIYDTVGYCVVDYDNSAYCVEP